MSFPRTIAFFVALVLAAVCHAAPPLPPPEVLIDGRVEPFKLTGAAAHLGVARTFDVAHQPFQKAIRVDVRDRAPAEYALQLGGPVAPLKRGDVVLLTAHVRATRTTDETGSARVGFVLEQPAEPYTKVIAHTVDVLPNQPWRRVDLPAKVATDLGPGGARLLVRLGHAPQTVEVGGIELRRFTAPVELSQLPQTRLTYPGREPEAAWRKQAEQRIEQHRKTPLTVRVTDAAGRPVAGAAVKVKQRRHAFAFGSVYHPMRIVGPDRDSTDNKTYRDRYLELFNTGVDEYAKKWPGWEEPATRQVALDALAWMREHDIPVRGHTMVWPSWRRTPANLKELAGDPAALRKRVDAHVRAIGKALAGQVIEWDVVNEPYANNDLLKILGDDVMADWFKAARAADPHARLYLNETGVPTSPPHDHRYDVLYDQAKAILDAGGPLGGVGMQAHFGTNLNPPAKLLAVYDRFATLGVPVRITELDIDVTDESLQADYLRDFMTASFSHPNVNGVLVWGFWEGAHWRPNAAFYRKDWSIKPVGQAWKDLVLKQWRTNVDGQTAGDGTFATRAFHGDYTITVSAGGQTTRTDASVHPDAGEVNVRLDAR